MFHIVFFEPRIPQNSGNAIRLSAITGCTLHLIEPLGFDLSDAKLKRAGLDYHDLAHMQVHKNLDAFFAEVKPNRVFAFTTQSSESFAKVEFVPGDTFMFGPEPTGLPQEVAFDERVTTRLRIPMLPGARSLNLANSAAITVYEAWRQQGFPGAV